MLIGSTDITFCPVEECDKIDCRRHYIHTKDIPQGTPYSVFTENPRKEQESCPYYWQWYTKEAMAAVEESKMTAKEKRRKYNTEYQRKIRRKINENI